MWETLYRDWGTNGKLADENPQASIILHFEVGPASELAQGGDELIAVRWGGDNLTSIRHGRKSSIVYR